MLTAGWLARLEVRAGRDHEFETFLAGAPQEPGLSFALRFGRSEYGVFGLGDGVAVPETGHLLASAPRITRFSVLASKPADAALLPRVSRALLLSFPAKEGQARQLEKFLAGTRAEVQEEPGTAAWYALRFATGAYGTFAAFTDNDARFAHLTGAVPRELTGQALALLGGVPDMDLLQVVAAR